MLKVRLNRDLRKKILQGHPWIYKDNITPVNDLIEAQLCEVLDRNKKRLAWGFYSPNNTLAIRILSTGSKPPNQEHFESKIQEAIQLRSHLFNLQNTNSFRLINGEGDLLPGLTCDIYNKIGVIQFDGDDAEDFWKERIPKNHLLKFAQLESLVVKKRNQAPLVHMSGAELTESLVQIKEKGRNYFVDIQSGQKTGFFLDQRNNRSYVQNTVKGKSVLNLFSFSGGFSVAAGIGNAKSVVSVDRDNGALLLAKENWKLNKLDNHHEIVTTDVFEYLNSENQKFDFIVIDPPSMAPSEARKKRATHAYQELFEKSISLLTKNGELCLSSCSSHIDFNDFMNIISLSLTGTRKTAQILRTSGQGEDHPYPHACPELNYLKFVHLKIH